MYQQNLSCWWNRLQSPEFQNPLTAGYVFLVTFVLAIFLDYISFLLRLPCIFLQKKVASIATEKKYNSGNYFHFHIPDPHGLHILPQTTEWSSPPPQQYLLTLGFRNKHIGKILEKLSSRKLPIFSGTPTCLIDVIPQGWPPQSLLNEGDQGSLRTHLSVPESLTPSESCSLPIILIDPLCKMYMKKQYTVCDFIS